MLEKGPMSRDRDRTVRSDEHNSRGIELADRGWLDEAIKEFKKAIDLDPDSAHAHDNLATPHPTRSQFPERARAISRSDGARAGLSGCPLEPWADLCRPRPHRGGDKGTSGGDRAGSLR